eukprot:COSAG05_NODE_265_length_12666_cov_104.645739_5_plen_47_part_00
MSDCKSLLIKRKISLSLSLHPYTMTTRLRHVCGPSDAVAGIVKRFQ